MLRVDVPYVSRSYATRLHTIVAPLQRSGLDSGIRCMSALLFGAEMTVGDVAAVAAYGFVRLDLAVRYGLTGATAQEVDVEIVLVRAGSPKPADRQRTSEQTTRSGPPSRTPSFKT